MFRESNDTKRSQEQRKFQSFLEEFSWLMASYSNLDFKSFSEYLKQRFSNMSQSQSIVNNYLSSTDTNAHFLAGALPRLFMDRLLFPANEDIAQFASTVMNVKMPHFEKKSRFELIGTIVCRTYQLNNSELHELVAALTNLLTSTENTRALVVQRKRNQVSWNQIIQELAREGRNASSHPQ